MLEELVLDLDLDSPHESFLSYSNRSRRERGADEAPSAPDGVSDQRHTDMARVVVGDSREGMLSFSKVTAVRQDRANREAWGGRA